jgi:transposase-like protein
MGKPKRRYTVYEKRELVRTVGLNIERGMNVTNACRSAGIPDQSYRQWKKDLASHPTPPESVAEVLTKTEAVNE